MTRVKSGVISIKWRRNALKKAKGYRFGRSTKLNQAMEALAHAGKYAFAHRRDKKGDMRRLWNVRINSASKPLGISYSKLIGNLKKHKIALDRKILSTLAHENPETFKKIIEKVK